MLPCASLLVGKEENTNRRRSVESFESDTTVVLRNKRSKPSIWRTSSLANLIIPKKRGSSVFESTPSPDEENISSRSFGNPSTASVAKDDQYGTIVSVVIVEARDLPNVSSDGSSHRLYCKIRLGSHTLKSKSVTNSQHPIWRERLQFHRCKDNLLKVSLWDKGKQKSFMGSCVLDLSQLEEERTHDVWHTLDDGFGHVHLSVTMCNTHRSRNVPQETNSKQNHGLLNLYNWNVVGELQVKVVAAKGLTGKPLCVLEVDNERVQTQAVCSFTEVTWDRSFVFKVYDVTSILDLRVYDGSHILTALRNNFLGRVTIPLLKINNGQMRWYALKDMARRHSAKGNYPRVLLEMSLYWNPMKASLKVFKPKEVKYSHKQVNSKYDISLVYKNLEFIKDALNSILYLDQAYKQLFEWENREYSCIALFCWLFFWYLFRIWTAPLLMLAPFLYCWIVGRRHHEKSFMRGYGIVEESSESSGQIQRSVSYISRLHGLPEMTLTITNGIDYLASLTEKLFNLASFKVPFLSYLTMFLLVVASIGLYLLPFNYIMMIFGLYKFSRKYFDPERVLNNDIVDFLSRIPDTQELIELKELNIPEPSPTLTNRSKLSLNTQR